MDNDNEYSKFILIDDVSLLIKKLEDFKIMLEVTKERDLDFARVLYHIHDDIKDLTNKLK